MDLTLSPEQEAIRTAIRELLAARLPLARVRAVVAAAPGFDEGVWGEAASLGWLGLGVPEGRGGAGYALPEEMILFTELGRALTPGPWLGTVLAAQAGRREVLDGRCRVAVVDDGGGALGPDGPLTGTIEGVADAGGVHGFLVLRRDAVCYLPADAPGLTRETRPSMDPTRPLTRLACRRVPAERLDADAAGLRRRATVLAAAEAVGVAERTLEQSVEHARVRQQFGRPIGSFQAVKHRCADMAVRAEVARSVTAFAAVAVRDAEPDAPRWASDAKALATDAALANASDNVQNHGGMGFTWEADAHLYLKRAWLLEHAFGTRAAHLDALAAAWRV